MAHMQHNSIKAFRPSDLTRLGLAGDAMFVGCQKASEWYETPGAGGRSENGAICGRQRRT